MLVRVAYFHGTLRVCTQPYRTILNAPIHQTTCVMARTRPEVSWSAKMVAKRSKQFSVIESISGQ